VQIDTYTPPRENLSSHLLSARPKNPSYTQGASTSTRGVSSLYVVVKLGEAMKVHLGPAWVLKD
jgi:hypothetical protein